MMRIVRIVRSDHARMCTSNHIVGRVRCGRGACEVKFHACNYLKKIFAPEQAVAYELLSVVSEDEEVVRKPNAPRPPDLRTLTLLLSMRRAERGQIVPSGRHYRSCRQSPGRCEVERTLTTSRLYVRAKSVTKPPCPCALGMLGERIVV